MFTSLELETQWTTVAASLIHRSFVRANEIHAYFFLVDCEKTVRTFFGWRQWETHSSIRSKQTSFAKQSLHNELLFWSEPASSQRSERRLFLWHSWTSRTPLTTYSAPLRQQRRETQGYLSNCCQCSTKGGPRATSHSPSTKASSSGVVSRQEHRSKQRHSWLLQITSWLAW